MGFDVRAPRPAALTVAAALVLAACGGGSSADRGPVLDVPPLTPEQVEAAGVLGLAHVSLGRRAVTREYRSGLVCTAPRSPSPMPVKAGEVTPLVSDTFFDVMGDALGFPVAGAVESPFNLTGAEAEFLLAATIDSLHYDLCRHTSLSGRHTGTSGSAEAEVHIQLLDRISQKVVYDETIGATATLDDPTAGSVQGDLLAGLFGDALSRLAADNAFRRALVTGIPTGDALRRADIAGAAALPALPTAAGPAAGAATATVAGQMVLPGPPLFREPMTLNVDRIRAATVTVLGITGHGSGFFITPDGWLLTNDHVVEGADVFRVRLADNRDLWARVERRHPLRDVALLKAVGQGFEALPIRPTLARVSETTYAIGAPNSPTLGQSVSQGIVSAYRPGGRNGLDVYQATTPIHAGNSGGPLVDAWGNVVALTVSTITDSPMGLGAGLNFFVPIHDALAHLGVRVMPAASTPATWQAWIPPAAPIGPAWGQGGAAPGPWPGAWPGTAQTAPGPWTPQPTAPPSPTPPSPWPGSPTPWL